MSMAANRGPDQDPGSPLHERDPGVDRPEQAPVDAATWDRVREYQAAAAPTADEGLDAYDRTVAASFPASDPPPPPGTIGGPHEQQ